MLRDRVEQTSTTTGTGTYSLTGTVTDRVTFVGAGLNGKQVYYLVVDLTTPFGYEFGIGTVTDLATDTLSRDTIIGSSNGGLAVNWGAGTRQVMCAPSVELLGAMGGRLCFGIAGGTGDAITLATPVPIRALTGGSMVVFEAIAANTGAATINVDSTGAVAIRKGDGSVALGANEIQDGQLVLLFYDSTRGVWQLLGAGSPLASAADYQAGTSTTKVIPVKSAWDAMAEVALTDGASIAMDLATGINFTVTLGGNRTLANPSNVKVGQQGRIRIVQDGTGGRTLAYGANWEFAGATAPILSIAAAAEDVLYYDCISATRILGSLVRAIA